MRAGAFVLDRLAAQLLIATVIFLAISLLVVAGCATPPGTSDIRVRAGMSRHAVRMDYGEPLRIEARGTGGEDWYYRFAAWARPTGATGMSDDSGQKSSYASVGLELSNPVEEHPIHFSAEGYVEEPLPSGKVVKN